MTTPTHKPAPAPQQPLRPVVPQPPETDRRSDVPPRKVGDVPPVKIR